MSNRTVFLSSTWDDLIEHRQQVLGVLNRMHLIIESMENNGAFPLSPKQWSIMHVRKADIYIGIFGIRYGTVDPESGKSITELEYEAAKELKIPCLIYLIDEDNHQILPKFFEDDEKREKLKKLKNGFNDPLTFKRFRSVEDLAKSVALDLVSCFQDEEAIISSLRTRIGKNAIEQTKEQIRIILKSADNEWFLSKEIESIIISSELGNGNSNILSGIISFDPIVENRTVELLKLCKEIGNILARELLLANDPFIIRLLTILVGRLKEDVCTESICKNVLYGHYYEKVIKEYGPNIHPYYYIARRALSVMNHNSISIIKKYSEIAKEKERWHAKKVFDYAINKIEKA